MTRLRVLIASIAGGFWFLPSMISLLLAALAAGAVSVEARFWPADAPLADMEASGARAVLSTVAGGMMTVASIVFSLTFVALSTMSSQFGPRIILFFMQDRTTQSVLGVFVGSFLFALIGLLHTEAGAPPPLLAVVGAMGLSAAAFAVMIYFVHHIAQSLQADVLVARLGDQLLWAVDRVAARQVELEPEVQVEGFAAADGVLRAPDSGYVQLIDGPRLAALAAEAGLRLELLARPSEFILAGQPIALRFGAGEISDDQLRSVVTVGRQRTPTQEAYFEIAALTDVAVRALSPGINDPHTAIACVHRLAAGLARISQRRVAQEQWRSVDGVVRLKERERDFTAFLDVAFSPIRAHARGDAQVNAAILEAYGQIAEVIEAPNDLAALAEALEGLRESIEAFTESARDKKGLAAQAEQVARRIQERRAACDGAAPDAR